MNQQAGVKAASLTTSTLARGGLDDASNMQWQPWQHSTGALTLEGKATASRNAFKGGWRQRLKDMNQLIRDQSNALNEIK